MMPVLGLAQIDSLFYVSEPREMPTTVNSSAEEDLPLLSHDGSQIYFCRTFHPLNIGGKFAGQDIWYSKKINDSTWSDASNTFPSIANEFLNDEYNNAVVGMSANADTLYLINHYHHHKRRYRHHHHHEKTEPGLSYSVFMDTAWSVPVEIDIPALKFEGHHYGLHMNQTGDVLMVSEKNPETTSGAEDLYVIIKNGDKWSNIIHLGGEVNSESIEFAPFLCSDRKTLFFASDRPGGLGGFDIYYTERQDDSWENWSTPKNAGDKINSTGFDAYFSVSDDKHVLFARNLDTLTANLFIADIIDPETGKPLADKDSVLLSTLIDPDSYLNMERLVNLDTIVQAKDIIDFDPMVHKDINTDSLIYEAALDFVDKLNKDKGYKVVDLTSEEVRHLEKEALDSMKVVPRGVTIQFDFNIGSLDKDGREVLSKIEYILKNGDDIKVTLVGHTCALGKEEYNKDLSKQRAISARKYLISKGVDPKKISIKWQGETKPVATNETEEGRRINRRVEISFTR